MTDIIVENVVKIVFALLMMLIGVLGTWLTAKIGKRTELTNINLALGELFDAVSATVAELQQTTVDALKAAAEDGKLTEAEIDGLATQLYAKASKRISPAAYNTINAAGLDLYSLVTAYGEQAVLALKQGK